MDSDDSCCFFENNFDQFPLMNLLSPSNSGSNLNNIAQESNDQSLEIIDNLGFDLNSQGNNGLLATDDSSIFDVNNDFINQINNDFINQLFYDNSSPSTSDSGNYSPTCSDDQSASDSDRKINVTQGTQIHPFETKFTVTPNPTRLVPVQIPVRQIVTNGKNISSHPLICIMPTTTYSRSINSQPVVNQDKQRILSPKHERPSSMPTFTSAAVKNYDRKKEDRKIRNRYSAQLSRIRKKNEIDEMKRNLVNKDVIIEKLKSEIEILKGTVETLRRENEMLKSGANERNSSGRLNMVAGVACLNLDPTRDTTGLVTLNLEKSDMYSLEHRANIGRALLSLDYDGDAEYTSGENRQPSGKSDPLSQSNMTYSANCDNVQKKYLNQTEAMKFDMIFLTSYFKWRNRNIQCLEFDMLGNNET
ncbi:unnamed protein product [Onchocerca ochengi]|uniref:BZIP domain-containing protein n=1 Tax=Onchocerca ochengi TaxID=42157 RepID=A0A182EKB2_ONCOC|nr:unnamed protein product [Onchocerca ochengi]